MLFFEFLLFDIEFDHVENISETTCLSPLLMNFKHLLILISMIPINSL